MSASKPEKTNVMRILEQKKIPYVPHYYAHEDGAIDAVSVAGKLGQRPEQVFKTLVLRGEKQGILVCVLPVELEVDLKKLARAAGDKKVEMIHMKELLPLTGYIRGGCSPVGMKKKYPTFLDETCELCDRIAVSAGQRGVQMLLRPADLARYVEAKICDIAQ